MKCHIRLSEVRPMFKGVFCPVNRYTIAASRQCTSLDWGSSSDLMTELGGLLNLFSGLILACSVPRESLNY